MTPRLDAAFGALKRGQGGQERDLRGLRVTALAFKLAVRGPRPIAVAYAVDEDGIEHWLAARSATRGVEITYLKLFSDLLVRGLQATRPLVVDADGCPRLAARLEHVLGPVVHAGVARAYGGCGLAW
jgi:hypothetical protein